ncbi:hypothetical protein EDB84DRAFT_1647130 [Lactarius hengduanensis]|nr:hypothetical protein EDB84DRAFT_1647130 [Lactarius hengduanensis]
MSALHQSARNKARQGIVESETSSVPDSRKTAAAERRQSPKGKPKGKTQRAAPKAKSVAKSTNLTAGSNVGTESESDNPVQSVPHKRGLPKGQDTGEDSATQIVEPVGKKPKVGVHTAPESPRVKTKKPIPPRSPLPQRINRVVQPGKPVMPRPKRTSAEVAAAQAEKVKLSQEAEELDKQNKLALAEMELNEEAQDAVEERMAVRHLADLRYSEKEDQAEPRDDVLEERPVDEDGPQDENDEPPRSEDECLEPETMPKAQGKKKKPAKGETRKAVEAMTAELRQAREETLVSKRPGANNKTEPPRKHLRETVQASVRVTKPSGFLNNWQSRAVSGGGQTKGTPNTRDDAVLSDNALGGLADEDADSKRPSPKMSKGRDVTRKNEIIRITGSDSEVETSNASRKSLRAPTSRLTKQTVKSEPSFSSSNGTSRDDEHRVPSFIVSDWTTRFLPTLYHIMFCSERPFHDFGKGTGLLRTVQQVVDLIFPDHSYFVTVESKLYVNAYDRLVEKRSEFGVRALQVVDKLFKQVEYTNNVRAVSEYAIWATKRDGPALWGVPSPQGVSSRDEDYVKAKDLFESQYMIDVLTSLVKKPMENSLLLEYGHPKGAVALAAAGVERAFFAFHSGWKARPPFSTPCAGGVSAGPRGTGDPNTAPAPVDSRMGGCAGSGLPPPFARNGGATLPPRLPRSRANRTRERGTSPRPRHRSRRSRFRAKGAAAWDRYVPRLCPPSPPRLTREQAMRPGTAWDKARAPPLPPLTGDPRAQRQRQRGLPPSFAHRGHTQTRGPRRGENGRAPTPFAPRPRFHARAVRDQERTGSVRTGTRRSGGPSPVHTTQGQANRGRAQPLGSASPAPALEPNPNGRPRGSTPPPSPAGSRARAKREGGRTEAPPPHSPSWRARAKRERGPRVRPPLPRVGAQGRNARAAARKRPPHSPSSRGRQNTNGGGAYPPPSPAGWRARAKRERAAARKRPPPPLPPVRAPGHNATRAATRERAPPRACVAWILALPVVNFLSEILQADMRFRLLPETFYSSVSIIDRFLSVRVVSLAQSLLVDMRFRLLPETLYLTSSIDSLCACRVSWEIFQAGMRFRLLWDTYLTVSIVDRACFSDRDPPVVNFLSEILQAGMRFHLLPETLCLTVNIIDRFLSAHVVTLANSLLALDIELGTLPVIRREFTAVLNYIPEPVRHPSFFVFPTNTPSHNQHACLTAVKIQGVDALKLPNTPASYLFSAVISNAKPLTRK